MGEAAKPLRVEGFKTDCNVVLPGTLWHSDVFRHVSKVVFCGRRSTFAFLSEDELQFSWQAQHFGYLHRHVAWQAQRFRSSYVSFANCIVRAASSSDTQHSTLHTPHFTLHALHTNTLHFTLSTLHFTLYNPHFYTFHSTLDTSHFTLHTSHFLLHILHLTLHTLHSLSFFLSYVWAFGFVGFILFVFVHNTCFLRRKPFVWTMVCTCLYAKHGFCVNRGLSLNQNISV